MSISNKSKKKISKLINNSDSGSDDDNEHELFYYVNDRIKLMKQVLKIIKPKKIKSMAPECIRHLDIDEINSMLLEELLGISNKRLKYIFNGQNVDEESSSSTDPEDEQQPIDVISLDDVSDDDFQFIDLDADSSKKFKNKKLKKDPKIKAIKKEKQKPETVTQEKLSIAPTEENLMSVLELLELQARARAIRSQLLIESSKKNQEQGTEEIKPHTEADDDADAVIIESPKNEEIVISSSESESENSNQISEATGSGKNKKIKLIRDRIISATATNSNTTGDQGNQENIIETNIEAINEKIEVEDNKVENDFSSINKVIEDENQERNLEDTIVINVDETDLME